MTKSRLAACAGALALLMLMPLPSFAQAARAGKTFAIGGATVPLRNPDIAYDPVNDRYLVVNGNGFIEGQLLDTNGTKIAGFTVNASRGLPGQDAQTPRVAFSRDLNGGAGGYFVTWHETFNGLFAQVHGRIFNAGGQPLTGDLVLSPEAVATSSTTNYGMGAAIAYSTTSHEFLVTWQGNFLSTYDIKFTRVGLAGNLLQQSVYVTTGPNREYDPNVAYNPDSDEFMIVYAGSGSAGYVGAQRVKAGSGGFLGAAFALNQSVETDVPAIAYNTASHNYMVSWSNVISTTRAMYGVTLRGTDGAALTPVQVVSARYTSYDALDMKYNPKSGDYLLVTYGASPTPWEDAAVSIRSDGVPIDAGFIVTNTADVRALRPDPTHNDGNFSPRLVPDSLRGRYLMVTSSVFTAVYAQFVQSSATGGGSIPNPPPPPPSSNPVWNVDTPTNGATIFSGGFTVAGWATDTGSAAGTGVDVIACFAYPASGAPAVLVGTAAYGGARPDIGGWLGPRFTPSGFGLTGKLAPGAYSLVIYAHSTVTNAWTAPKVIRVNVTGLVSNPRMNVDVPAKNGSVPGNFVGIAGWALDLGDPAGNGVGAVHIYAYPAGSSVPVFLGAATLGDARPDVAGAFGANHVTAGWHLQTTLAPGQYNLVVFSLSLVTGTFNNAQVVPITVR